MNILVTGGEGFIGSALVNRLIERGHKVASFDIGINFTNFDHYYNYCILLRRKLYKNAHTSFKGDVRDKVEFDKALLKFKAEVIVHLAALPMARPPQNQAHLMIPINLNGTINVLESFEKSETARRFIFASSSMAYGHFLQSPQVEDFILNPVNTYGTTKAAGELFVRLSKKEWVIVRAICVYGFADCADRVTQLLLDAAIARRPAWIVEGERLDFTYLDDVVDGYIRCIEMPEAANQTFNISRGAPRPVKDYAEIVKKHFPQFKYEVRPSLPGHVNRGGLDITRANTLLGFNPKYNIEDGVKHILRLMKRFKWDKSIYENR